MIRYFPIGNTAFDRRDPGGPVYLNPQPLPPRSTMYADWLMLNPQPLPPRSAYTRFIFA
jgi:hypothetical protein